MPDAGHSRAAHAGSGLLAAAVFVLVGWVVALLIDPPAAPHIALGDAVVDLTPPGLKDFAIATFGTADKLVLFLVMAVVAGVAAAAIGILAARQFTLAVVAVCVLAVVCAVAAVTRPDTGTFAIGPSVVAAVAGIGALHLLIGRATALAEGMDRRRFLSGVAGVGAGAVLLAAAGGVLTQMRRTSQAVRDKIVLPEAADPAPPIPPAAQVDLAGMPPFVTPNKNFYRIDTALVVPQVDPDTWELRVHGLVDTEVRLTFADLLDAALVEAPVTLTCVSNTVGGDLAGNATWLGLPVREVLARAGVHADADMVLSRSVDGFTASTPIEALTDDRDALLAVAMNGEPLPVQHGFPVRMVVPGLYGYVSATKWLTELEVTRFADVTAYWTTRGWDALGPIKTASRIDVPRSGATVPAGSVIFGGTAWAQGRGIDRVEVQVDDGPWQDADLAATAGVDTWRQWSLTGPELSAGQHAVRCRAWDNTGVQTDQTAPPAPNGSSGYHVISLRVE